MKTQLQITKKYQKKSIEDLFSEYTKKQRSKHIGNTEPHGFK